MAQPGESGEHWDQAQPALWAWPSLAGDPGLAGAFCACVSCWCCWGSHPQAHPEPVCLMASSPLVCGGHHPGAGLVALGEGSDGSGQQHVVWGSGIPALPPASLQDLNLTAG